jgi:hypothetical protein
MEATEIKNETVAENEAQATVATTQIKEAEKARKAMEAATIPEALTQQQALQVLVDAARVAQSKGIFTLDDAELVNKAIKAFMPPAGPVASNG